MKTFNVAITPEIKATPNYVGAGGFPHRTGRARVDVHATDGEVIFDYMFETDAEARAAFKIALAIQAANK